MILRIVENNRCTHCIKAGRLRGRTDRAFTLVEIIVVVLIIGILAAVAAPKVIGVSSTANEAALRETVNSVRDAVEMYSNKQGEIPATINLDWFHTQLSNPFFPGSASVFYYSGAARRYPTKKDVDSGSNDVFWYSPDSGNFYARVPKQATDKETVALFNRVNCTDLTSLSQIN